MSTQPRARWARVARWGFFLVAALALWNTLRNAELERAAALALGIGPKIVLVAVPFLIAMMLQTAGYARILAVLGSGRRTGLRARASAYLRLLSVMLSSEAVLMSVPAGAALAETINPYLLKRRLGVPMSEGFSAVAAKKAIIVFTNGLYIGIAVIFGAGYLQSASRALIGKGGLEWIVAAGGVAMIVAAFGMSRVLFSGSMAARSHGLLRRIPSARLRAFLDDRKAGFVETDAHFAGLLSGGLPALFASAALILGCWLVEGAEALVILRLLGVDMPFTEVLAFEVVVSLLRSLAFMVPAGLGVQDAGYVAFLGAFGVPDAATLGVAFVLIKRVKELFYIALGFVLFVVLGDAPTGASLPAAEPSLERA
ncbi:MAG: lysylphosphatidylglycerol synthase domain-containing protein [Minicystis sp.]